VGELPLIYQATLSIWETQEHMRAYAYKNPQHLEAIKKTKELNWYSEELFGRFYLLPLP
jgi:heme-degrading monooxygenase HmoA